MNVKRSYPTDLIILHQLNMLPHHILVQIPSSTLDNWKKRNMNALWGTDCLLRDDISILKKIGSSKKLLAAGKAMCFVYDAFKQIIKQVKNYPKLLHNNSS